MNITENLIYENIAKLKKSIMKDDDIVYQDVLILLDILDPYVFLNIFSPRMRNHNEQKIQPLIVEELEKSFMNFCVRRNLDFNELNNMRNKKGVFYIQKEEAYRCLPLLNKHIEKMGSDFDMFRLIFRYLIDVTRDDCANQEEYKKSVGQYFEEEFKHLEIFKNQRGDVKIKVPTRINGYVYPDRDRLKIFLNLPYGTMVINKSFYNNFMILKPYCEKYLNSFIESYNKFLKEQGYVQYSSIYIKELREQILSFYGFNKLDKKILKDKNYLSAEQKEDLLVQLEIMRDEKPKGAKTISSYHIDEENIVTKKNVITTTIHFGEKKTPILNKLIKNFIHKEEDYHIEFEKINNNSITLSLKDVSQTNYIIKNESIMSVGLKKSIDDYINLLKSNYFKEEYRIKSEDDFFALFQKEKVSFIDKIKNEIRAIKLIDEISKDKTTFSKKKI